MGKGRKGGSEQVPNPSGITNRDLLQRLNFLYQASVYLQQASTSSSLEQAQTDTRSSKRRRRARSTESIGTSELLSDLSKNYAGSMKAIGAKAIVKMDPVVKRTMCKACNTILVPGTTASVRVKPSSSHRHAISYTCTKCRRSRVIPAPPRRVEPPSNTPAQGPSVSEPYPGESARAPTGRHRKRKRGLTTAVPFFEREVGHVVFRGSHVLLQEVAERDE
ncbi:hypothetical protein BOTBODRAFT_168937 [Botryobasidium botryosum FD-172 SS1]|uniref:Rpr2-domain-containing protein n=1 Tax=Botryobasidium botryosum (strain FD-172 SS1) TaxID=930990 RepID=A0A067ND45_BOTB1|nr:hypothetical protein BOTBODRAFT_168937 [Botryobasidium botryosum FD-172 SS1]